MTTTTIKKSLTFRDFGNVAEELGVTAPQLLGDLERIFGERWIKQAGEISISVVTPGVQDTGEVIPPTGYVLAEGVTDTYVGAETVSSAFVIKPSWHAVTGLFSVEVTPSDGLGDFQTLAPEEALKLAADITAVTEGIRPVNITAAEPVAALI